MKHLYLAASCVILGGLAAYLGLSLSRGQPAAVPAVPKELTSYRDIVKRVLPAVVSLEARAKNGTPLKPRRPGDMTLPEELRGAFDVPRFDAPRPGDDDSGRIGFGSGFLISPKGVIVTNNHVVEGADRVIVQLKDGKKLISTRIHSDPKTDLAIVLVESKALLPALEWGDSDSMEIGDRVLAVGAPFGLTGTVTSGIVSSVGRSLRMNMYEDFLQTDAAINPGNSGGPLVGLDGKVIGIASAIKSKSGGFQGIGLAISSNLGRTIVDALLKDGKVKRGYLGVGVRDLTEERAKELGVAEDAGVEVSSLYPDAPGDKAGLKKGDVLTRVAGKPVRDSKALQAVVAQLLDGQKIEVRLVRDRKPRTVTVTIEEQPARFGTKAVHVDLERGGLPVESVGLVLNDLTPELAEALGFADGLRGALIIRMTRSGIGAAAGLEPGQLITAVEGKPIRTAREGVAALKAGSVSDGIKVDVRGPRGPSRKVTLKAE